MKIKKFIAPSLPEALAKIKQDMGEEAVILKTRFNALGHQRIGGVQSAPMDQQGDPVVVEGAVDHVDG